MTDTAAIVQKLQAYRWETSSLALFALKKSAYRHGMSHKFLPKMSDECPRYIFRQDTLIAGDEIRPEYQPQSIGLIPPSVGKLCYN